MAWLRRATVLGAAAAGVAAGYAGVVTGAVTVDTGWGRRMRALGPQTVEIAASRETVFEVIAQPYLGRTTRAMREKVRVLERGEDIVLAAHYTPVAGGRLTTTTVETVRFERPHRVAFRLLRGPVPHVTETFDLTEHTGGTRLEYRGELGTDGGPIGARWGTLVARSWDATVAATLADIRREAEHRARR
ncbi:SRPBCC family protein [Streptomyces sp. DSM 42041]|uniref:SRPBCC family protein n=1 Tax=Streptomyces hazeniae TaxID=3075538 RepID=A0ABU2P0C5_9ACTN|nr:SRPBCC family protein [Streptomyces sp. DSM 42041]MDT0382700.1 SRPBCC family protein [Streptomyces sp. DSM 42041]